MQPLAPNLLKRHQGLQARGTHDRKWVCAWNEEGDGTTACSFQEVSGVELKKIKMTWWLEQRTNACITFILFYFFIQKLLPSFSDKYVPGAYATY